MRLLTICQPYAHLIVTPQSELPAGETRKRVENRSWRTAYRGPVAIHAGLSRKWLSDRWLTHGGMVFGAILGTADLIACVSIHDVWPCDEPTPDDPALDPLPKELHWMRDHEHTDGPACWVLANVRRLVKPVPYKGMLGLSNLPESVVGAIELEPAA